MRCYITKNPLYHIGSEGLWWSSPIKIRTQCRLDLFKRDRLRPVLIVVGQDQFIIEHIHSVHKCINQSFLKITVCWIAMTELLKPCRHLFAGQLWLLQFSSLDIHKDFFFSCFQLIKPLFGGRRENALLDCFQNVSRFPQAVSEAQGLLCLPAPA